MCLAMNADRLEPVSDARPLRIAISRDVKGKVDVLTSCRQRWLQRLELLGILSMFDLLKLCILYAH